MNEEKIARLRQMAEYIRRTAIEMAYKAGRHGAHLGGSLSCVEIYAVLYGEILRFPEKDRWDERDRMIVGKEHARLAEYPAMVKAGLIKEEDLDSYLADDGALAGHPYNPEIGLEYSCCSLGMALPVSTGMAINAKRREKKYRVYTILGDGEMDEGLVWEAIMSAAHYKLGNLTAVVDRNGLSSDGNTEEIMALGNLKAKFDAFGWECINVEDGNDIGQLLDGFEKCQAKDRPSVIIANTVKGKGLSFVENVPSWHQNYLTEELYQQALNELEAVK